MCEKTQLNLKQALLPALVWTLCVVAQPSMACQVLSKEQAEAGQEARIATFKAGATALHQDAEFVFVGRMSKLTFREEGSGTAVGGGDFRRVYQATFDGIDNIKGTYAGERPLGFTINDGRVVISCDSPPFKQDPPSVHGTGEWYLVYARAGTILRANPLQGELQALTGQDEAMLVRNLQK